MSDSPSRTRTYDHSINRSVVRANKGRPSWTKGNRFAGRGQLSESRLDGSPRGPSPIVCLGFFARGPS